MSLQTQEEQGKQKMEGEKGGREREMKSGREQERGEEQGGEAGLKRERMERERV